MNEAPKTRSSESIYGVMTTVLDEMLREREIAMPYLEAPVKESLSSEKEKQFFDRLDDLLDIPETYRGGMYLSRKEKRLLESEEINENQEEADEIEQEDDKGE